MCSHTRALSLRLVVWAVCLIGCAAWSAMPAGAPSDCYVPAQFCAGRRRRPHGRSLRREARVHSRWQTGGCSTRAATRTSRLCGRPAAAVLPPLKSSRSGMQLRARRRRAAMSGSACTASTLGGTARSSSRHVARMAGGVAVGTRRGRPAAISGAVLGAATRLPSCVRVRRLLRRLGRGLCARAFAGT